MAKTADPLDIYLELGKKKAIAAAVLWPGWCRSGKDEQDAVQRLVEYAPRYSKIAEIAKRKFEIPATVSQLNEVARLQGNATTDFGVPVQQLPDDPAPLIGEDLERCEILLKACWEVFDRAVQNAEGKELRKGPRGGGRDLQKIVEHVAGAEEGYTRSLGWQAIAVKEEPFDQNVQRVRNEVIQGLRAAARGELAPAGPRGGKHWPARYFVRRLAWHVVDHTWEIEDRIA